MKALIELLDILFLTVSIILHFVFQGFVTECSRHDLYKQELDEYDTAISTILEELDKFVPLINLYFVYIN